MHVVVVGCGRVGSELALSLERHGHSVAVIDKNADAFRKRLPEDFGGQKVVGFGFDRDHLDRGRHRARRRGRRGHQRRQLEHPHRPHRA